MAGFGYGYGFGLSRAAPGGGGEAPAWSPAPYFASYSGGHYWDPNDRTSLAQDAAGITPAAIGSPVGLMGDPEGDGLPLAQTSAVARPILRESGGESFLEHSGAQWLTSAALAESREVTLFLRVRANGAPAAFASPFSTYVSPGAGYRIFNSGGNVVRLDTAGGTIVVTSTGFSTTMKTLVMRWVNGRQMFWWNGGSPIVDVSNAVLLNHTKFNIGVSSTSGTGFWIGDIGRAIVIYGGLTAAEINAIGVEISRGNWSDVSF